MNLEQKSIIIKFIIVIAFAILSLFILDNTVLAASISSDIDGIDETKYPGYKEKIKQLQSIYPNIQVLYTGIDWDNYNLYIQTYKYYIQV